ncbi:uncharacterized protein LOC121855168, partial [Homarus americanus]|uniref:uncharacterized protein LOC121855168 n=1 Tax=Homarus americanus TaxID=6706 RepID=UPI001C464C20
MDGENLVGHFQVLKIPGAEHLVGESFDWLYLTEDSAPLAAFLKWFTENVSTNDVLTDAELNEYEELMSKGEVLTGHQLGETEAFLSGLPTAFTSSQEDQQDIHTVEEHKRLAAQLEVLSMRKNLL